MGTWFSGMIVDMYKVDDGHNWQSIWYWPAVMAVVVMVAFAITFNDRIKATEES